jgi:hypothetical protein
VTDERKKDWVALAILAALPTLLFADVLLGFHVLYTRDVSVYHYPLRHVLREIVLGGEFPYWNPSIAAGQPLAANPAHALFYPLTWLVFLPDFNLGFHLHALAHLYIATFGMYALLRSMQTRRTASVLAALSFGLGGLLVSTLNLFPFLFSTAWIPWICLYARRALKNGTRRDFACATLFLALQLLVAEPTTTLQTGALIGLYALFHGSGTIARRLGTVAAMCGAAILIAAVQIIPAIDHFGDSVRSRGIPFEMVAKWSLPPVRAAELINPNLIGEPDPISLNEYWGGGVYRGSFKPFFYSIYSGLLVVIGAVAGLATRRRGSELYVAILAISFFVAIGAHTPLLRLLYDTGVANAIRYTEKFAILGIFASVVFAGRALDDLLRGDAATQRAARVAAIAIVAISSAIAIIGSTSLWEPFFRRVWLVPDGFDIRAMLPVAQRTWVFAAARAIALLLILLAFKRLRPPMARALLGLYVVADVGSLVPAIAPRVDASYYDEPAFTRALPRNRGEYRVYHHGDDAQPIAASDPYFRPQPGHEWLRRNTLTPYSPATYGFRLVLHNDFDLTTLLPSEDFRAAMAAVAANGGAWIEPAITMSNVQYAIVYRDPRKAFAGARDVRDVQPVELRFVGANPRYWFARELIPVRDARDFAAQLQRVKYVPGVTFIEGHAFRPAPARVLAVHETTQGARIEVEALGPAFLVMSVTPHKYWHITLDGAETDAIRTNIGYQGVNVPPGKHVIEMRYANPLIAASGAISLASLLGLFLFVRRSTIDRDTAAGGASEA